jgi:hypothetical protein
MVLEQKDILQINATIIAGAFIFISLVGTIASTENHGYDRNNALKFALIIIIFFSVSSFLSFTKYFAYAITLMKGGFALLAILSAILIIQETWVQTPLK